MGRSGPRYEVEIRHDGLNKFRLITGQDPHEVEEKARAQLAQWDAMWERRCRTEARRAEQVQRAGDVEAKKQLAEARTRKAEESIKALTCLLKDSLEVDPAVDWNVFIEEKCFSEPPPLLPAAVALPREPQASDHRYRYHVSFLGRLFGSGGKQKALMAKLRYQADHAEWQRQIEELRRQSAASAKQYKTDLERWQQTRQDYESDREQQKTTLEQLRKDYENRLPKAIAGHAEKILRQSKYPVCFPKTFRLEYNNETQVLCVDYSLPSPEKFPHVKQVKYVPSRDEVTEVGLSDVELNALYDEVLYQTALRSLHELFVADEARAFEAIVFNGWVRSIDRATGKEANACLLSVQTNREEFLSLNLAAVDPKACFKKLKGVGSSQLHSLTPVAPLLQLSREDKRFVSSYEVANTLDERSNIAAMDWQDFENLIRELFAKIFGGEGAEVKVTRASRDGGVDAVAFDPDPIRGGKIVIQAKRYTNTVGVSAVRDLYGTVLNEGATKGILVSTSDYGPDAYSFAKDKPLTLLNGSNLLHLLEEHGHKVKIDLKEAKQILSEKEREEEQG